MLGFAVDTGNFGLVVAGSSYPERAVGNIRFVVAGHTLDLV